MHSLRNNTLRYEVIYKNLLRDLRKFYVADFNKASDFIRRKRRLQPTFYIESLKKYVLDRNILKTLPFDAEKSGASVDSLVFNLGSLIYPKDMLRCYNPD